MLIDSFKYCQTNPGMNIYCWCIMPSHVHIIFSAKENNPEIILGRFKEFTSKNLIKEIESNPHESGIGFEVLDKGDDECAYEDDVNADSQTFSSWGTKDLLRHAQRDEGLEFAVVTPNSERK